MFLKAFRTKLAQFKVELFTFAKDMKKPPRFIALTGIAFQMGLTIYLGSALGKYLDQKYPLDKNWFTIVLTLVAVVISFYNLLRQVNKLNDRNS